MNSDTKISVIIPAYNIAQWLPRCIDSVMTQTHTHLEILLIDDGSTDNTGSIIDEYAARDPRIIAVHQENTGLVSVREKGISLATGTYVSFVDGDDVIEKDFLEKLLSNALKYNADISHCGMKYCFYDGRVKLHYGTGDLIQYDNPTGLNELLCGKKIEPSLCNKLYRRELLADSCLDLSVMNNEDLLRNFILFSRAKNSVFEDFCGYQYWRRAESMSNSGFNAYACRDVLRARSLILNCAPPKIKAAAKLSYLNALISCYNASIDNHTKEAAEIRYDCKKTLNQFKKDLPQFPIGLRLRAAAILTLPFIYHPLQRMHVVSIRRKIRNEVKNVQKN